MSNTTDPFDKRKHKREPFDCQDKELNQYLKRTLSQDISKGLGGGYVYTNDKHEIVAYYTLQGTVVSSPDYTEDTNKKVRYNEVPAFLIGRLAVDYRLQNKKIGAKLLLDALARCFSLKNHSGGRYIVVEASSEKAKKFYEKYGFSSTQNNPMKLLIPMKFVEKIIKEKLAVVEQENNK